MAKKKEKNKIKDLKIHYSKGLELSFNNFSKNHVELDEDLEYENTIKINNQLYIKLPEVKKTDDDECTECHIMKKNHPIHNRSNPEFRILGKMKLNSSVMKVIGGRTPCQIYLSYNEEYKSIRFIEYFKHPEQTSEYFKDNPLVEEEKFETGPVSLGWFLKQLRITPKLDLYYGELRDEESPSQVKERKKLFDRLKIQRIMQEDKAITDVKNGFSKRMEAREKTRSNARGIYPRSKVIQVNQNHVEQGHEFQSKVIKPSHKAYPSSKNVKRCYIQFPPITLGPCTGTDDGEPCQNYKKAKDYRTKNPLTQGRRSDLQTIKFENMYYEHSKELYGLHIKEEIKKLFENRMKPLELIHWTDQPKNQASLFDEDEFGQINIKNTQQDKSRMIQLLQKHILYYFYIYREYCKSEHDAKIDFLKSEKLRENVPPWIIHLGKYSGWGNYNDKIQETVIPFLDETKLREKPDYSPKIPIILYNLFYLTLMEYISSRKKKK